MFNNPISYAGYPPGANGKANNTNSTVRAATAAEALAGVKTNVYITPAEAAGASLAPSVAGATPLVNNSRRGQVSFTNVVNTTAYGNYVMTNSLITSSSVIQAVASCATTNTALVVSAITPGSGTVTFRLYNAGSANTAANVIINYEIYN
jgi:hypothetical protein